MMLNRTFELHSPASVLYCTSALMNAIVENPYWIRVLMRSVVYRPSFSWIWLRDQVSAALNRPRTRTAPPNWYDCL